MNFNFNKFLTTILILIVLVGGFWYFFDKINPVKSNTALEPGSTPENSRLDILVLGIRGKDDPDAAEAGVFLTDTIQIFSLDQNTKKATLVSVPRDLYIKIDSGMDKINVAYEYGVTHGDKDFEYIKELISSLAGVHIDKVVVFDFYSFKSIIDSVGGVDITLSKPFEETTQWGYKFSLPAGLSHLNGQDALYYARSRYSSNDFDRSRRQQEIVTALKDKLVKLNFFRDPIKSLSIFNSIRKNINTDIGVTDLASMVNVAQNLGNIKVEHYIISTENLLTESYAANGAYILLPKNDDWDSIRKFFKDILTPTNGVDGLKINK